MRSAIFAFGLAVVFGLALGLLLTGTGPGASGIVGGQYWILVIVAASVYMGWQVAQLSAAPLSLVAAPVLGALMVALLLGVKFVRMPSAPLVGDGFEVLVLIYAAAALLGALLGHVSWLRAHTPAEAARTGLWLAAATVTVTGATYARPRRSQSRGRAALRS
jgi:hypothetical protein